MPTNTFLGTGALNNWSSTSNWSLGALPTINDLAVFTASSGTVSVDTVGTCSSIDFTNYSRRVSFSSPIVSYGDITLGVNTTYTYSTTPGFGAVSGHLICTATASLRSNGATFAARLQLYNPSSNPTFTLTDNWTTLLFGIGQNAGALINRLNGATISVLSNVDINNGANSAGSGITGSATIECKGSGTLTLSGGSNYGCALNVLVSGSYSFGTFYTRNRLFKITGTLTGAAQVLNWTSNGSLEVTTTSASPIALRLATSGNFNVSLSSTFHTRTGIAAAGGNFNQDIYIYGGVLVNTGNALSGNTIYVSGTGSGSTIGMSASAQITNNLVINTPGTATFTGNFNWYGTSGGSFVYTAGNVSVGSTTFIVNPTTAASTLTFNSAGINWFNLTFGGSSFILNNNNIVITNNLTLGNNSIQFNNPWTCRSFNMLNPMVGATNSVLLKAGNEYIVTGELRLRPNNISPDRYIKLKSTIPGSLTYLTFNGFSQSNWAVQTNDIDSRRGNIVWCALMDTAISSNTFNWNYLSSNSLQGGGISIS